MKYYQFIEFLLLTVLFTIPMNNFCDDSDNNNGKKVDKQFSIVSITGNNGTISPLGLVNAIENSEKTFLLIPKLGYTVDTLMIDDAVVMPTPSDEYTFTSVKTNHKISVTFKVANVMSIGCIESGPGEDVVGIAVGDFYSVGIKKDGSILTWWQEPSIKAKFSPVINNIKSVAICGGNSVALKKDGTIVEWDNQGNIISSPKDLGEIMGVARTFSLTVVLKKDGTVKSWLSRGGSIVKDPINLNGVIKIAAGIGHVIALKSDGTVVEWGDDSIKNPGIKDIIDIAAGHFFSMALKKDGTISVWGHEDRVNVPKEYSTLKNIVSIAAGPYHVVALRNDGTAVAWGDSRFGKTNIPKDLPKIKAIAAGGSTTMFLFK